MTVVDLPRRNAVKVSSHLLEQQCNFISRVTTALVGICYIVSNLCISRNVVGQLSVQARHNGEDGTQLRGHVRICTSHSDCGVSIDSVSK